MKRTAKQRLVVAVLSLASWISGCAHDPASRARGDNALRNDDVRIAGAGELSMTQPATGTEPAADRTRVVRAPAVVRLVRAVLAMNWTDCAAPTFSHLVVMITRRPDETLTVAVEGGPREQTECVRRRLETTSLPYPPAWEGVSFDLIVPSR